MTMLQEVYKKSLQEISNRIKVERELEHYKNHLENLQLSLIIALFKYCMNLILCHRNAPKQKDKFNRYIRQNYCLSILRKDFMRESTF